jgi:hypothetical protein
MVIFLKACQYVTTNEKVCQISNMFLSSIHKEILRSASLGPKTLGGKSKSGIELALILEFSQQN